MSHDFRRTFLLPILALFVALAWLVACGGEDEDRPPSDPQSTEEVLDALRRDRAEVDAATDRILERLEEWNREHGGEARIAFADLFPQDLNAEQRSVLEDLIAKERDASYRGLLEEIVQQRDRIRELEQRIFQLESRLPGRHVTAARGDTHYDLALGYLVEEAGLDETEARRRLADVNLFQDLWPGHRVWLWYDAEASRFATWVTTGEAAKTPLAVQRAVRRGLIEDREAARRRARALAQERDALAGELVDLRRDVTGLRSERSSLERELTALRTEREAVEEELRETVSERERLENALFYHAASEQSLKDRGLVRDTLFTVPQLEKPESVAYDRSQDLREETTLEFEAADYGLRDIRKVVFFPRYYEEGRDYRVRRNGNERVTVDLLDPAAFRGRRVVIALKGAPS